MLDEDGKPALLSGIVQDITVSERQKSEILQRNLEINLLYEAGRQISESLNLESIYLTFFDLISNNMKCDTMYIASFDLQTGLISAEYAVIEGKPAEVSGFPPIPLEPEGRGIQSPVIRSGIARNIHNYPEELKKAQTSFYIDEEGKVAGEDQAPKDGRYTQSSLIILMKLKNQVTGVVQIQSYALNAFSDDDFRIAQSLVSQITVAANNASLYQQSLREIEIRKQAENTVFQQAAELSLNNEKIKTQVNRLEALRKIDETINASMELEITTSVLVEQVMSQLKVDAADILLLNPVSRTLEYTNGRGFNTSALQQTRLTLRPGVGGPRRSGSPDCSR